VERRCVAGDVTVPAAGESFTTADRGGLAADSLLVYEWDVSDRMTAVETAPGAPGGGRRLEFTYDYRGRRMSRTTYAWNAGTASWDPVEDKRFVYDGWNLVAELDATGGTPVLVRSFLWGLDLAGLQTGTPGQGAGGIGGLISMTEWSGSPAVRGASFYAVSDGNGNVSVLVDVDSAAGPVETLEYGPFGRVVAQHRADGGAVPAAVPSRCPFGFSSKYLDTDSGLLYFGYRYYSVDLGRWLCRDPLGEKGGANLYAYCQNDPVNAVDPLGLARTADDPFGDKERWERDPDQPGPADILPEGGKKPRAVLIVGMHAWQAPRQLDPKTGTARPEDKTVEGAPMATRRRYFGHGYGIYKPVIVINSLFGSTPGGRKRETGYDDCPDSLEVHVSSPENPMSLDRIHTILRETKAGSAFFLGHGGGLYASETGKEPVNTGLLVATGRSIKSGADEDTVRKLIPQIPGEYDIGRGVFEAVLVSAAEMIPDSPSPALHTLFVMSCHNGYIRQENVIRREWPSKNGVTIMPFAPARKDQQGISNWQTPFKTYY
jgi:RHS repeat-associated protein